MALREAPAATLPAAVASAGFVRVLVRADGDGLAAGGLLAAALAELDTPFQVTPTRSAAEREGALAEREALAAGDVILALGPVGDDADALEARLDADGVDSIGSTEGFDTADGSETVDASENADATEIGTPVDGADAGPTERFGDGPIPFAEPAIDRPASRLAWDLATRLGADPDPVVALAGGIAAGFGLASSALAPMRRAAEQGELIDARPGLGIPTGDPVEGLAHSGLVHAPWSGDTAAVGRALEGIIAEDGRVGNGPEGADGADGPGNTEDPGSDESPGREDGPGSGEGSGSDDGTTVARLDEETGRRLASAVAVDALSAGGTPASAAAAIEVVLQPATTPGGPLATVEGLADVLGAVARDAPGIGIALAAGRGGHDGALSAWRTRGPVLHAAVRESALRRSDGIAVLTVDPDTLDAPGGPGAVPGVDVARVAAAYRAEEPIVVAVVPDVPGEPAGGDGAVTGDDADPAAHTIVAVATDGDLLPFDPAPIAQTVGAAWDRGARWARFAVDPDDADDLIDAIGGAT